MTTDDAAEDREAPFPRWTREFMVADVKWIARLAGGGAAGSGAYGLALIESIEFATAGDPATPVREVLVQHGIFHNLHDSELRALLAGAPPLSQRRTLENRH